MSISLNPDQDRQNVSPNYLLTTKVTASKERVNSFPTRGDFSHLLITFENSLDHKLIFKSMQNDPTWKELNFEY